MFIPFGAFLPIYFGRFWKMSTTVLAGAFMSFTIEVLQLFTFRLTDIDDLIMNTLGTLLGDGSARKPEFALHLMEKFDNIDCDARCNRHNRKAFAPQCKEYRYDKTRGGTQPPVSCIEDCRNRHCGQNCIRNVCEKRAHEAVVDFLL